MEHLKRYLHQQIYKNKANKRFTFFHLYLIVDKKKIKTNVFGRTQLTMPCMAASYRGEEHGETVDGCLRNVEAPGCHDDGRQERQVAQREQQSGEELATVGQSRRIISAPPTLPACKKKQKKKTKHAV